MLTDASPATAWRWGDYLLLPAQRRLLHRGEPVEIEDRAFDLIVLLLQHRERALDRQEVIAAIWGKRPVSDATLRQLVYKARRAIGDDGEHQNTICTLYGRSVQWVAPVEMVFESAADASAGAPECAEVPGAGPAGSASRGRRVRLAWLALAGMAAVALAGGFLFWRSARDTSARSSPAMPRLAIEPIANDTGDPSLDWAGAGLPGLLGGLLDQRGGMDVVPASQVAQAWKFTPTRGRSREQQLKFVTSADVLIGGRLRKLAGNLYELDLRVLTGDGDAADISVDGQQPGLLAVQAVPRIRARFFPGESGRVAPGSALPNDQVLAEAFARGMDLQAQGKAGDALSYFKLVVEQAPGFGPGWLQLGISQSKANDVAGSQRTFQRLLAMAKKKDDPRVAGRTLIWLGRNARMFSTNSSALEYFREALPYAERAHDVETEIDSHLLSAITAHTLGNNALSAEELGQGKELLGRHPEFRRGRELMDDARDFIALENGDAQAALGAAQAALAMYEEDGDERASVVGLGNIAVALSAAHRNGEAITTLARALQRANADHYEELQFVNAGNLALDLLNAGLTERAIALSGEAYGLARHQKSETNQIVASQIRAEAQLQALDSGAALATLQRNDAFPDLEEQDPEVVLNQDLLEALADFDARPERLPALRKRMATYVSSHKIHPQMRNRELFVDALADAAAGHETEAIQALRAAEALKPLDSDGDLELRLAPLLIAVRGNDPSAAESALKGYDPDATEDACLLRLEALWMRQRGDPAAAQRALTRLDQLRKGGLDALAASGVDPDRLAD
ncbi:MAG TPA: winged helix-turn-helix domain-containing protein [Rhodanobacteraceae bacterium]